MAKKLPANFLRHLADYSYAAYFVDLPPGFEFEDLFTPGFWSHHNKLREKDLIRVRHHEGKFDLHLTVLRKPVGGAVVDVWPRYPEGTTAEAAKEAAAQAAKARPSIVPILPNGKAAVRVDHVPAQKWRVIALDQSVLAHGFDTREAAEIERDKYLASMGMTLPPQDALDAASEKAKAEQKERLKPRPATATAA